MRSVLAACLACALGACAGGDAQVVGTLPSSGEWKIERRADRISDQPQSTAVIITRSRNARMLSESPAIPQLASLQLMCFDNEPVVRLHFTHGIGSNRNSRLAYRFDRNPGRDANARILQDLRTIVIEDKNDVLRFADEMRTAHTLSVQVSSLTIGMSTADFKVEGAPAALDAAYSGCPLPVPQKPRVGALPLHRAI